MLPFEPLFCSIVVKSELLLAQSDGHESSLSPALQVPSQSQPPAQVFVLVSHTASLVGQAKNGSSLGATQSASIEQVKTVGVEVGDSLGCTLGDSEGLGLVVGNNALE